MSHLNYGVTSSQQVQQNAEVKKQSAAAENSISMTEDEMYKFFKEIWMTVMSSPHPQTAAAIENHYRIDTGNFLEEKSALLGFRSTESMLLSDLLSFLIVPTIVKDELNEHGIQKFHAVSFDDISHITNLMSESALNEEQKEARKQYFKETKYSKLEYKEKAIEMREKIAEVVYEYMEENGTNEISWEKVQAGYFKKYGQKLVKSHFHEAFPTGHPSKLIETYMRDEYILKHHEVNTGSLIIQFRRPYHEILEIFKEARDALQNTQTVIKPLEYRTRDNYYADYIRDRQRKDFYFQKKEEAAAAAAATAQNPQIQQVAEETVSQIEVKKVVQPYQNVPQNNHLHAAAAPTSQYSSSFGNCQIKASQQQDMMTADSTERNYHLPLPRLCRRY